MAGETDPVKLDTAYSKVWESTHKILPVSHEARHKVLLVLI